MDLDDRTAYVEKLAERGLEIHTFDGHTLRLRYNSAADTLLEPGRAADGSEFGQFAKRSLDELPQAALLFPGLVQIVVETGSI
jgi:hypothetical protein